MFYFKPALHLVLILFFTAYVMSSGPRLIRELRETKTEQYNKSSVSPSQVFRKTLMEPYRRIWQSWQPVIEYGLALIRVQGFRAQVAGT